jgi:ubiquitin-conjugating enzyme E2 variant
MSHTLILDKLKYELFGIPRGIAHYNDEFVFLNLYRVSF